jgi:hypothetical protein
MPPKGIGFDRKSAAMVTAEGSTDWPPARQGYIDA